MSSLDEPAQQDAGTWTVVKGPRKRSYLGTDKVGLAVSLYGAVLSIPLVVPRPVSRGGDAAAVELGGTMETNLFVGRSLCLLMSHLRPSVSGPRSPPGDPASLRCTWKGYPGTVASICLFPE